MESGSERQSTVSDVQQLLGFIQDGPVVGCGGGCCHGPGVPVGRLANDLAAIYEQRKDEESEKALAALLENKHSTARYVAYCVLRTHQGEVSPETSLQLEKFSSRAENSKIVRETQAKYGF